MCSRVQRLGLFVALITTAGCFHFEDTGLRSDGGGSDAAVNDAAVNDARTTDATPSGLTVSAARFNRVVDDSSANIDVTITRDNVDGAVTISVPGVLPLGVSIPSVEIAAGQTQGTLVVTAASGATTGAAEITIQAAAGGDMASTPTTLLVALSPGVTDSSFGTGGIINDTGADRVKDIAVSDGGRVYVLVADGTDQLVALDQAGAFDMSFGNQGRVLLSNMDATALAVRSAGGVMVLGESLVSPMGLSVRVFTEAGSPDTSFQGTGIFGVPSGTVANALGNAIAIGPDGTVYVAGENGDKTNAAVFRFGSTGTYMNFGLMPAGGSAVFEGIGLQADGKVVAVANTSGGIPVVTRFDSAVGLDGTFGTSGSAAFGSTAMFVKGLYVADSDQIAVVGQGNAGGNPGIVGVMLADGSAVDYQTNLTPTSSSNDVAIDASGRVVSASEWCPSPCTESSGAVHRFQAGGGFDSGFGATGLVTFSGSPGVVFEAIAIQPDGRIIAGGSKGTDWYVVRLWD